MPIGNLPGIEVQVKLNSAEVENPSKVQDFEKAIQFLISELVTGKFDLISNMSEEKDFKISISGLSGTDRKTYRINFSVGIFRFIYDGLYIVLSNNDIFHGVGQSFGNFTIPTLEVPDWNSLDLAIANTEDDVLFDLDRAQLHNFLYGLCVSFIMRHEIRHIANGHVDFLVDELHPLFYENSSNGLPPLDSQTLEMDVDSCVFAGMLNGFLNQPEHINLMPEPMRNERGIFSSLLFAIQFLFYCMPSRKVSNLSEAQRASHPNAYMRYFYCFTTGLNYLQDNNPDLIEEYSRIHQENFFAFLNNLEHLIDLDKIKRDYEWTCSDEGMAYAESVWTNWANWVPKLQPFAILALAKP